MRPDELKRRLRKRLDALGPPVTLSPSTASRWNSVNSSRNSTPCCASVRECRSRKSASGEVIWVLDLPGLSSSKSELFLQLLGHGRRRTAEAEDRLGKRAGNQVHGRVLPIHRPTVGNEVLSDEGVVSHDHRGSMSPMNLGTCLDVIQVERTDPAESLDVRHPMKMKGGDHHVRPRGPCAIEVPGRRDVCASASRNDLLFLGQATADCCIAIRHQAAEVSHGAA